VSEAKVDYTASSLTVYFEVTKGSKCPQGLDVTTTVIISVVVSVVGVLAITLAIILSVPKLRTRIFPYRDRERFQPTERTQITTV